MWEAWAQGQGETGPRAGNKPASPASLPLVPDGRQQVALRVSEQPRGARRREPLNETPEHKRWRAGAGETHICVI